MVDRIHVPTSSYTGGRSQPISLIVLHTTESPSAKGRAVAVAQYLARLQPPNRASAHYVVDEATIVDQVAIKDTAWTAAGSNAQGVQIEQCGRAGWSTFEWQMPAARSMLANTRLLLGELNKATGIPLRHLTDAELAAGAKGVVGHDQVSRVFGLTDHWDPGPDYPWNVTLTPGPAPTPDPFPIGDTEMAMPQVVVVDGPDKGTVYALDGPNRRAIPIGSQAVLIDLVALGILLPPGDDSPGKTYHVGSSTVRTRFSIAPVWD